MKCILECHTIGSIIFYFTVMMMFFSAQNSVGMMTNKWGRFLMSARYTITIDGPAATGKSTAGKEIAAICGLPYVYTGLFFRAFAWALKNKKDEEIIKRITQPFVDDLFGKIEYQYDRIKGCVIFFDGCDITSLLKCPEIDHLAPIVANNVLVRHAVLQKERFLAREGGVIDSRDAGTVVFPDAEYKFFFTASLVVRAQRVYQDWQKKQIKGTLDDAIRHIKERDDSDATRGYFKLVIPEKVIQIDTSMLSRQQVLDQMILALDFLH